MPIQAVTTCRGCCRDSSVSRLARMFWKSRGHGFPADTADHQPLNQGRAFRTQAEYDALFAKLQAAVEAGESWAVRLWLRIALGPP